MTIPESNLTDAIASATLAALTDLRREHPDRYYYITLITSGEAHAPFLVAWSEKALLAAAEQYDNVDNARKFLKWSYADSPYMAYGDHHFARVREMFAARPEMRYGDTSGAWELEFELRLSAMEAAMARLDAQGVFGHGIERTRVIVAVEVMPPDDTNTQRIRRLNPSESLTEWLLETSEQSNQV